jgi:hypothetical protein
MPVIIKCFERLVMTHIYHHPRHPGPTPVCIPPPYRYTDHAISIALHTALSHLDKRGNNYVRILFIDYSSAFNTIVPSKRITKLGTQGLNTSLFNWILDFLTGWS